MKSHVNHEGAVTVPKTHTLVLLVLAGAQLELLLYTAVASRNLADARTHTHRSAAPLPCLNVVKLSPYDTFFDYNR